MGSSTLFKFSKRYTLNMLRKRFNQWRNKGQLVGSANRSANIVKFVRNVDYYLSEKKKNKKYGVALEIMTGLYFNKDRKKLAGSFRKWNMDTVKDNLEKMTYRLLAKIMNNMVGKNDNLNSKERLQK